MKTKKSRPRAPPWSAQGWIRSIPFVDLCADKGRGAVGRKRSRCVQTRFHCLYALISWLQCRHVKWDVGPRVCSKETGPAVEQGRKWLQNSRPSQPQQKWQLKEWQLPVTQRKSAYWFVRSLTGRHGTTCRPSKTVCGVARKLRVARIRLRTVRTWGSCCPYWVWSAGIFGGTALEMQLWINNRCCQR